MALLQVHSRENEIILNTPNRNEILKEGPPPNSQCNILGRGAYGTVFKAVFRAQRVAVKVINNLKDMNMQSIQNEANILGWVHRNIVKILEVESTPNFSIVIMERFPGQCLQLVLDTVKLPMIHRVFISIDILTALSYCHKRGLLHLDVKPQNVLVSFKRLTIDGQTLTLNRRGYICKLCDFGSSMKVRDVKKNVPKGAAVGTVRYMSPEVLREEVLTPAADIYAFGITMWQLQHRQLPYFWIECNEVVAYQVVKSNLRPDSHTGQIERCLDPDVIEVPQNCFCMNFSEIPHQSWKHVESILYQKEKLQKMTPKIKINTTRRPFQELNAKPKANAVRDLRFELGVNSFISAKEIFTYIEDAEEFNLAAVFRRTGSRESAQKASSYAAIYKSCWNSDLYSRPTSSELRKGLEQLL